MTRCEESFRTVIERAPELIIVHRHGRVVYINAAGATQLGYDASDELVGAELTRFLHADEHEAFAARVREMVETGKPAHCREFLLLRKSARPLVMELVGVPIVFDGEPAIVSIARDVTERRQIQAHLLQTDRLIALGTLAAGVAHEINNPLTYVLANLELVAGVLEARAHEFRTLPFVPGGPTADTLAKLATSLRVAHEGAERVRRIVRDLTIFARAGEDRRALLDVRSVIEPMIDIAWNEIQHRARLVRDFRSVPLIHAPEARVGQVFVNLLINATQAIPEGRVDQNEIRVSTYTDDSGRAVVEVADTGTGIAPEIVDRIFEPFFTTKPVGVGTGLGLSICHGVVTGLGGEITMETAPGKGSSFRVSIPAATLSGAR